MAVSSNKISMELLKLLGIDGKGVRSAIIRLSVGEPVMVDVERFADDLKDGEIEILESTYLITAELHSHAPEALDVTTLDSTSRAFRTPSDQVGEAG